MFFLTTDYTNLPRWITLIEKLMCNKKKISYGVNNLSLLLRVSSNFFKKLNFTILARFHFKMAYKQKKYGLLLYPISLLYGFAVGFRNLLFNLNILHTHEFPIPVIGVGNITVGGTGKTPHVEYIAGLLKYDFRIATLSRGYKRKTHGFGEVHLNSTTKEVGDEPLQIKNKHPEIIVSVDESRVDGIRKLMADKEKQIQVILLDDAFQHRYVKPGISILLIDYNRLLTNDHFLPYGNLREREHNKIKANIIIITKMPYEIKPIERRILEKNLQLFPYQTLYFTNIKYKNPVSIFPGKTSTTNYSFIKNKYHVLLVTGIANHGELIKHIKQFSLSITHLFFKDHYSFKEKDIEKISKTFKQITGENKVLITTEKDSLRLRETQNSYLIEDIPSFYIPIEIDFLYSDKNRFNKQITEYVRKNKPVSSIYSERNK